MAGGDVAESKSHGKGKKKKGRRLGIRIDMTPQWADDPVDDPHQVSLVLEFNGGLDQFPVAFNKDGVSPIDHDLVDLWVGEKQLEGAVPDQICQSCIHHLVTDRRLEIGLGIPKGIQKGTAERLSVQPISSGLILHTGGYGVNQKLFQMQETRIGLQGIIHGE